MTGFVYAQQKGEPRTIRLFRDVESEIEQIARDSGGTVTSVINHLLIQSLRDLEKVQM